MYVVFNSAVSWSDCRMLDGRVITINWQSAASRGVPVFCCMNWENQEHILWGQRRDKTKTAACQTNK